MSTVVMVTDDGRRFVGQSARFLALLQLLETCETDEERARLLKAAARFYGLEEKRK